MTDAEFRELAEYLAFDWMLRRLLKNEQSDVPTGLVATEREAYPPGSASRLLAPTDDGTPTVQSGPVNNGDS